MRPSPCSFQRTPRSIGCRFRRGTVYVRTIVRDGRKCSAHDSADLGAPPVGGLFSARNKDDGSVRWFTPGGGLVPGESHEQAALRELQEETGPTHVSLGPETRHSRRSRRPRSQGTAGGPRRNWSRPRMC
ncbi:NUDIX domain-containing protein [Streptomyces iakyrus]|uniref:NUDIX domain-containing protein n=1 Tax=Streptomyces iakyrus TaxID=68219 RepID=UPI0036A31361